MKVIDYRALYSNQDEEIIRVRARDINSGFGKALSLAKEPLGNGTRREIVRIEFWEMKS